MAYNDDDNEEGQGEESAEGYSYYEHLLHKLQDDTVMDELVKKKGEIENLLGCPILIQVPVLPEEHEMEIFDKINNHGIDLKTNTLKVSRLLDLITTENKEHKVFIDPIHLSPGLNPMVNLIVVTMEDYIILVPKNCE